MHWQLLMRLLLIEATAAWSPWCGCGAMVLSDCEGRSALARGDWLPAGREPRGKGPYQAEKPGKDFSFGIHDHRERHTMRQNRSSSLSGHAGPGIDRTTKSERFASTWRDEWKQPSRTAASAEARQRRREAPQQREKIITRGDPAGRETKGEEVLLRTEAALGVWPVWAATVLPRDEADRPMEKLARAMERAASVGSMQRRTPRGPISGLTEALSGVLAC